MKIAALNRLDIAKKTVGVLANRFVDLILPGQCLSCARPTQVAGRLCASCWVELSFIEEPLCDRLGTPFAFDPGKGVVSVRALAHPPLWERARAAVEFDDRARRLIHGLKYHDRHEFSDLMAGAMSRAGRDLLCDADMIIPVPLHFFRMWQRRFNQSALLAKDIAKQSGVSYQPDYLFRKRATRQQVGLKGKARIKNVAGAFAVRPEAASELAGKSVVLVDDVMTTGATAKACTKALLAAGCQQVDVLTFALVNNQTRLHI